MFVYTYQCNTCEFRGSARSGQIGYYVFEDGERMPASTSTAWCRDCNAFTSVENLPTVDFVADEISRLRNNQINDFDVEMSQLFEGSLEEHVSSRLAVFTKLDHRFRDRQSANRCVECGGTDFDYVCDDSGAMPIELPHPNCHGSLRLVKTAHAIPATYFTLDREGNRIPATSAT